ncbi:MAG: hypothetical protein LBT54_04795 [Bifidobacteriaceae bacterium]|nr:hypothetical protein [Bifidobacteriaceae bacterium]
MSPVKSELEPVVEEALMLTGIGVEEAAGSRPVVVDRTYVPTGNRR